VTNSPFVIEDAARVASVGAQNADEVAKEPTFEKAYMKARRTAFRHSLRVCSRCLERLFRPSIRIADDAGRHDVFIEVLFQIVMAGGPRALCRPSVQSHPSAASLHKIMRDFSSRARR